MRQKASITTAPKSGMNRLVLRREIDQGFYLGSNVEITLRGISQAGIAIEVLASKWIQVTRAERLGLDIEPESLPELTPMPGCFDFHMGKPFMLHRHLGQAFLVGSNIEVYFSEVNLPDDPSGTQWCRFCIESPSEIPISRFEISNRFPSVPLGVKRGA